MAENKIISYDVELLSTNKRREFYVPEIYTNDLYTNEFQFNVLDVPASDLAGATATALLNMRDGSFFNNTDVIRNGNVFKYILKENEGNHFGIAKIQLVVGIGGKNYATPIYNFAVMQGLDDRKANEVVINDLNSETRKEIAKLKTETNAVISDLSSQWQQVIDETTGKDVISAPEIISARNGEANLKARIDKDHQEVTAQLQQKVSDIEFNAQNIFIESEIDRLDKVYRPALSLEKLPSLGNGTYSWNGAPYIQDNITIYKGNRYGIYVDFVRNPIVFKQSLTNGKFETFDLRTVQALETALALPTENNNHCTWSLMVDSQGYIHIAGNMHADPLRYVVSNEPENINTWTSKGMTGTGEEQVTYPAFVKMRDDELLFFYRSGISSNARVQVNKYNTATKTWTKVKSNLLDGTTNAEGVYLNHIAVDSNNVIHIMFMWRQSSGGVNNRDVGYAKSSDKGATWKKTNGTTYALPITRLTQETVLPSTGRGLINQSGLETDKDGNPHGVFIQNDSGGKTQIYHAWHDGTRWYNTQVTNFKTTYSLAGGRIDYTIARPSIFTTKSGRVYIIYRKNDEGYRGSLRLIDVTPGTPPDDFKLLNIDLNDYEPTFDTQALYDLDELHMIVGVMTAEAELSTWWNHGDNWNNQGNWILTVDLSQIDKLQNGSVVLPSIETLSTYNAITQGDIVIENTESQAMDISGLIVDKRLKNKQLFVRLKTRSNLVLNTGATGLYATLSHVNELAGGGAGGSITLYGSIRNLETGARYHYTPWIPIRGEISDAGSFITLNANVNNGKARFTLLEIELGVLADTLNFTPRLNTPKEPVQRQSEIKDKLDAIAHTVNDISDDVILTKIRQDDYEQSLETIIEETTDKDVISAPELIAARNGKSNLKTRLDDEHAEVTAQLAQTPTRDETGWASFDTFDEETRATLQGLSPGEINAVLGKGNVMLDNLSRELIRAVDNAELPNTDVTAEVTNYADLTSINSKLPSMSVDSAPYSGVLMKQTGKNMFNINDYLDIADFITVDTYRAKAIYLKPNTSYKIHIFVKDASLPPTMPQAIIINQDSYGWASTSSGIRLRDVTSDKTQTLTTDSSGLLYVNGAYLSQGTLDIMQQAFDIMITKPNETVTSFLPYTGEEKEYTVPFTELIKAKEYDNLFLNFKRSTDADINASLDNINGVLNFKAMDYEKLSEKIQINPQTSTTNKLEPLYVDSQASVMRYGQYTPDVMKNDERTRENGSLGNAVFQITGNAADEFVTVTSGNIDLTEIETDTYIAGVIGYGDNSYKSCSMVSVDSTNNRINVYPPLEKDITAGEIGNLCVDGLHLSRRGYRAFAQNAYNTNPKHAEKESFTDGFTPSLYLYGGDIKVVAIPDSGRMYETVNERNRQINANVTYTRKSYLANNPWDELLEEKSGKQVTLNTYQKTGYCEVFVSGIGPNRSHFKIKKDAGFEMYIEFYVDDVLRETYVKNDNLIEALRFDYSGCDTVKVVFYYNKVRKNVDEILISDITCWVNDYDYDEYLLPKYKTISQMFDSWGVFHDSEFSAEMQRLINERDGVAVGYTNNSKGSQTSQWGIDNFYENVEKYKPKTMLIDFGINDANLGMSEVEYKENMLKLCDMAIANDIQPIICFPSFGNQSLGDRQLLVTHKELITE